MNKQIINKPVIGILAYWLIGILFSSCDMTERFKEELDDLPQVSNYYKYGAAYAVGDTLEITGILYPGKGLKVYVGGSEASIVKTERIGYAGSNVNPEGKDSLDRVSVIITEDMGAGTDRPVLLELKGNTVYCNPIEIYTLGGDGSFTQPLKLVNHYTFTTTARRTNTYLHCINGKGEIYYINHTDRNLYRINKDASRDTLLTSAQVKGAEVWSFNSTTPFLGGGVNPQGTKAWFTVITSQYNYLFCEADLQTKTTRVLNTSTAIGPVYQGAIGDVNVIISGAYPDSKGNVYVKIGTKNNETAPGSSTDNSIAIAHYNVAAGQLKYLFKTYSAGTAVPGKAMNNNYYQGIDFRFYPEEGSMYLIQSYSYANDNTGESYSSRGLVLYNLNTRLQQNDFYPGAGTEIIGPFTEVKSLIPTTFGLMPLPGQRILGLAGYDNSTAGYPKLLTIGFTIKRVYQYAPETLDQGTNTFEAAGTQNELLNYDEDGHLYMTANRRANIVKTEEAP